MKNTRTVIRRDPRTIRQKIFSKESFTLVHLVLAICVLMWAFWQVFGRSAGFIDISQWEMDNIWKATGLMTAKIIVCFLFAATHRSVRNWWSDTTKVLDKHLLGIEQD